jgi:para-nitrobenzyl esterase
MIIGTCKDETAWLIGNRDTSTFTLDEARLRSKLTDNLALPSSDIEELIGIYRKSHPEAKTPSDLFFLISSDRGARMNAITQAERKTEQNKAPAYMYYFTYNTPILDGRFRAFHTAELPLVLRLVRYPNSENLSKHLAGSWAAFARTGNPNHKGLLSWPAYNATQRATMVFGEEIKLAKDPDREARLKFRSLPPQQGRGGRVG